MSTDGMTIGFVGALSRGASLLIFVSEGALGSVDAAISGSDGGDS